MKNNRPYVIDIKANSLDDGDGVRTTVFFKGCPLSCVWCHNPESKKAVPELAFDREKCIGCGTCVRTCKQNALGNKDGFVDREKCIRCFACAEVCPSKALERIGLETPAEEIIDKVLKDKIFYDISGGGVTLSGGEATLCTEWVGDIARKLKEKGVNVLLETCGYFDYEKVRKCMLPYLKDIYCDLKIFDRELHQKYCNADNRIILDNFASLARDSREFGFRLLPRIPLIPEITDTRENLTAIAEYLSDLGVNKIALLPYNPTWYAKVDKIGSKVDSRIRELTSWHSEEQLKELKKIFEDKGFCCC